MLYSKDLISTLSSMSTNNQFSEMVFYLEACESGSMFDKVLSEKLRIYATTAANPTESSYACDYDEKYKAYLNDCYTMNFLNDTSNSNLHVRTLQDQFVKVKETSTLSNVCQYGDLSIASQPLSNWFSNDKIASNSFFVHPSNSFNPPESRKGIVSRDVKLDFLLKKIKASTDEDEKQECIQELESYKKQQSKADVVFGAMSSMFDLHYVRDAKNGMNGGGDNCHSELIDHDCIKEAATVFESECGKFNEYSIRYASYLNDACMAKVSINQLQKQLNRICSVVM